MSRIPTALAMIAALATGVLSTTLTTAADSPSPTTRKAEEGELFPDAGTAPKPAPKKPGPKTPAPKPAPKPVPRKPLPPTSRPVVSSQPAAPSGFVPTHRITLVTKRVIDGIPTTEGDKVNIKLELGSISVDQSQIEKMEPLPPKQPEQP